MSKIDTINSRSNLNCIADELFTELTPEAAEVMDGGGNLSASFTFQEAPISVGTIVGPKKGTVSLATNTFSNRYSTGYFQAYLVNTDSKKTTSEKEVDLGLDSTVWTGLKGDSYQVFLKDNSNDIVSGSIEANFV